jgi:L-malate glycosyltransferase
MSFRHPVDMPLGGLRSFEHPDDFRYDVWRIAIGGGYRDHLLSVCERTQRQIVWNGMTLCLLADAASIHTRRWAEALAGRGHLVTVLSLRKAEIEGATVVHLAPPLGLGRLGYLATARRVRAWVRQTKPDLLHAHYASSYGLLGALTGYHPYMVSVWGSDVFEFPRSSRLHAALLRYNLRRADVIGSTSHRMKEEAHSYTDRPIHITPFGVDVTQFSPPPYTEPSRSAQLVVGMVKTLEPTYGVLTLIEAFRLVADRHPHARLLIVGSGRQRESIQAMIRRSQLDSRIELRPAVPHSHLPDVLRKIDIFVVPSLSESFGVAAIEASACGVPVVASRVGGLPEAVIDGKTGILVPPGDPKALAGALERLIGSEELRARFGQNGRRFVEQCYAWEHCVDLMEQVYASAMR